MEKVESLVRDGVGSGKLVGCGVSPVLSFLGTSDIFTPDIFDKIPKGVKRYIDPIFGGGEMFFHIMKSKKLREGIGSFVLNDERVEVYDTLCAVRDDINAYFKRLDLLHEEYRNTLNNSAKVRAMKEYYETYRGLFNKRNLNKVNQAAIFSMLNKICMPGLFRIDKHGDFKVPFGKVMPDDVVFNPNHIVSLGKYLNMENVRFKNVEIDGVLKYAIEDSFFFFNLPFRFASYSNKHKKYYSEMFGDSGQEKVLNMCEKIHKNGNKFMVVASEFQDNNGFIYDFFRKSYRFFKIDCNVISLTGRFKEPCLIKRVVVTNY